MRFRFDLFTIVWRWRLSDLHKWSASIHCNCCWNYFKALKVCEEFLTVFLIKLFFGSKSRKSFLSPFDPTRSIVVQSSSKSPNQKLLEAEMLFKFIHSQGACSKLIDELLMHERILCQLSDDFWLTDEIVICAWTIDDLFEMDGPSQFTFRDQIGG